MNATFYEQLGGVAGVFERWGACERTVVACTLARRVPVPGLRLLQRAVDAALRDHGTDERLERDANDETVLASLLEDDDDEDECLRRLLTLLPLLRTDNAPCKDLYVSAAPRVVQRCVDARRPPELCLQLLRYLLVHPALTTQDQRTLTQWLRYLENHMSGHRTDSVWQQPTLPEHNIWGASTFRRTIGKNVDFRHITDPIELTFSDPLQESFSKNGRDVDISLEGDKLNFDACIAQPKSQRSSSLTPPSTNFIHMSSSAENLNLTDEPFVQKPRSFSLSSEHSLGIRPIIMYGTTGSETRLDDLRSNKFTEFPGMSTVAQWLKSLRLHKYVWLFTNISYEQMMAMDEEYLEKLGVTTGARHKLLLSINKLHERPAVLDAAATELASGAPGAAARALERLRQVLLSPMPPDSPLPAQIVSVLETASTCIPESLCPAPRDPDDDEQRDPMSLHCWLVEKALHHAAFRGVALQAALRRLRHRLPPRTFYRHVGDLPPRRAPKPRWRAGGFPRGGRSWAPPPRPKSHSYPPFPPAALLRPPPGDDYSSLDALCLQMTEQAIN